MSYVCIYHSSNPIQPVKLLNHEEDIISVLAEIGVGFTRRPASQAITGHNTADEVLAAYQGEIKRINQEGGYTVADVLSIDEQESVAQKDPLRDQLRQEHLHTEDEAFFVVAGRALLSLHVQEQVYAVYCEKGDLLTVPAQMQRWLDIGEQPRVTAVRLFPSAAGQHRQYTGSDVAQQYAQLQD